MGAAGASGAGLALADEQNPGAKIMFPSEYLKKKRLLLPVVMKWALVYLNLSALQTKRQ